MRIGTFLATIVIFLPAAIPVMAQEAAEKPAPAEEKRHIDKDGGFSFVPPEGWAVREFPGLKYKLVFAPAENQFAANINVVDEAYTGTVTDYIKATQDVLPKAIKKFRLIKREEFQTTAGIKTERMIIEGEQQDRLLRQTFYLFPTSKKMFVVTCTTLSAGGEKLDPTFEACMKTFRFEKPKLPAD